MRKKSRSLPFFLAAACLGHYPLSAAITYTVSTLTDTNSSLGGAGSGHSGDLRYVLTQINSKPASAGADTYEIHFANPGTVHLSAPLPVINKAAPNIITFHGNGVTIDGGSTHRGLVLKQGNVKLRDMTITKAFNQGASTDIMMGGALLIDSANVILSNVSINGNAVGGKGAIGGGILIHKSGLLTIQNEATVSGNTAYLDPSVGRSTGDGLFLMSGASVTFAPRIGQTQTILDSIGDDSSFSLPSTHNYCKGAGARLIMNGPGTLVLAGANTYHGGTVVQGGTLITRNSAAFGDGVIEFSGSSSLGLDSVHLANPILLKENTTLHVEKSGTSTLSGGISGPGELTITGSGGILKLQATNTHSGGTKLSGVGIPPSVEIDSITAIGTGSLIFDGGHLITNQTIAFPHNILIFPAGGIITPSVGTTATFHSLITGSGPLTFSGGGSVVFTNANPYTGVITLQNTSLVFAQQGSVSQEASIAFVSDGAAVVDCSRIDGSSFTLGSIIGDSPNAVLKMGEKELRLSVVKNSTYAGVIHGSGALTKLGSGTLVLSGSHNRENSWETHILQGTLGIQQIQSLGTGDIYIEGGGLEAHGDNISVPQNIHIGPMGARLCPNGHILTLTGSLLGEGDFSVRGVGRLVLGNINTSHSGNTNIYEGTLQITGSSQLENSRSIRLEGRGRLHISSASNAVKIRNLSGNDPNSDLYLERNYNTLTMEISENLGYAGTVSGEGSLIKQGQGTLTLSGPLTYSGSTQIQEGALVLSNSNAFTASKYLHLGIYGVLDASASGSCIDLNRISGSGKVHMGPSGITLRVSDDVEFAGVLMGDGPLIKKDQGRLILSNIHTYTGPTHIQAGQILFKDQGSIAQSSQVHLEGEAVLDISESSFGVTLRHLESSSNTSIHLGSHQLSIHTPTDTTIYGKITGEGGQLVKIGSGTLTLTNKENSHTGGIVIDGGAVQVTQRSALGFGPVTLYNSGKLQTPNLNVEGEGTLLVSTLSEDKRPTEIISGKIALKGMSGEDIFVHKGATLEGNGITKGAITVDGTLTSTGSSGFLSSSSLVQRGILSLELDPNNASRVSITGPASIAGTLEINASKNFYEVGKTYTVLSAHTLEGHFDTPIKAPPGFKFGLDISERPGLINLQLLGITCPTTTLSGNNLSVANYLNRFSSTDAGIQAVVTNLASLSSSSLDEAVEMISPARWAFATYAAQNTLFVFENMATARFNERHFSLEKTAKDVAMQTQSLFCDTNEVASEKTSSKDRLTTWLTGFGEFTKQKPQEQTPGFSSNTGGVLAGIDTKGSKDNCVGVALGYANTSIKEKQNFGSQELNTGVAGVYSTFFMNNFFFNSSLWGSYYRIHGFRNIAFSSVDATAQRKSNGYQLMPQFGFGYDLKGKHDTFTPFLNIDWSINFENKFHESKAGSLNMKREFHTCSMLRSEIGFAAFQTWKTGKGLVFTKEKFSYVNQTPFGTGTVTASFVGQPGSVGVETLTHTENLFAPGFEIFYESPHHFEFSISYEGEFSVKYQSNVVFAKIGKSF